MRDPVAVSATEPEGGIRLQQLRERRTVEQRRRLLVIINPYASTVSDRLRGLVVSALRGSYTVDALSTERPGHATELCRAAAREGYDAVVAFGGDGTASEAANGLLGTEIPLTCLPGGRANVYCRLLAIPTDLIDATEHLLGLADNWHARSVDLGRVGGRCFLFSAGVGLDASVVQRVDAHPRLKTRLGQYYYAWAATSIYARRYLLHPPQLAVSLRNGDEGVPGADEEGIPGADEESIRGITVLVQNAPLYTYFGDRGVEMARGAALDSGDLSGLVLRRPSPLDIPILAWRALSSRVHVLDHRQVQGFAVDARLSVRSLDGRPLPLQVDGDHIGSGTVHEFSIVPGALRVLC